MYTTSVVSGMWRSMVCGVEVGGMWRELVCGGNWYVGISAYKGNGMGGLRHVGLV